MVDAMRRKCFAEIANGRSGIQMRCAGRVNRDAKVDLLRACIARQVRLKDAGSCAINKQVGK